MTLGNEQAKPLVCLYEDRVYQIPGVKILLLSLARYCPEWPVRLRFPGVPASLRQWLRQYPHVELLDEQLPVSGSFNVKPSVLLDGLQTGAPVCLWIDTDVLINGSLEYLEAIDSRTLVVTQDPWEYADGSTHRSHTWALAFGRPLPGPLNSAVVRITPDHKDLLTAWSSLISSDKYLAEQAKPIPLRNSHMLGDQDVLSALLASAEFAGIPVVRLRHGVQILQHHGAGAYAPMLRWQNLCKGMPALLHAMGTVKPWRMPPHPSPFRNPRDYYERTYLELSPYLHFARQYESQLEENCDWMRMHTLAARVWTLTGMHHPALKGTFQAILHRLANRRRG